MSVPAVMTRCKFLIINIGADLQHEHTLCNTVPAVCVCVCVHASIQECFSASLSFISLRNFRPLLQRRKPLSPLRCHCVIGSSKLGYLTTVPSIIWAADGGRGRWKVKQAMFSTTDLQLIQHVKVCGESNNRELVRIRLKGFCGQFSASLLTQCVTVPLANGLYYFNTYHHHHVRFQCCSRQFRFDSHSAIHVKSIPYHFIIWCTYIICCCYWHHLLGEITSLYKDWAKLQFIQPNKCLLWFVSVNIKEQKREWFSDQLFIVTIHSAFKYSHEWVTPSGGQLRYCMKDVRWQLAAIFKTRSRKLDIKCIDGNMKGTSRLKVQSITLECLLHIFINPMYKI